MLNRIFSSVMIVTSAFTIAIGQTAEPKKESEKTPQTLAFSFDGGYLGVQTTEIDKENFAKFGMRDVRGVAVEKVLENSPAAAAGLKEGDVIIRFNGDEVTSSRKLTRLVSEVAPDHQVRLTISRNGTEQDITATIGKRPMPKFVNGNLNFSMPSGNFNLPPLRGLDGLRSMPRGDFRAFGFPESENFAWRAGSSRQIGVSVYSVTKQLGERYGVDRGLIVNEVIADSPAGKAGLKAGDIITEIDGKTVGTTLDLIKSLNDKKDGPVQITYVRDRNRQTVTLTPETANDGGFLDDKDNGIFRFARPSFPTTPGSFPSPQRSPTRTLRPARVI